MPQRKGENLKEIRSVSPLFIPLLIEIWAAITLKVITHFKSWQTFCQLDSLIVSLATTSKLYCWALNQQCSKSLGLGRELLPLGHRVELEYILCLSRSVSCDSCESPVPSGCSPVDSHGFPARHSTARRGTGERSSQESQSVAGDGGYGQRAWAKVKRKMRQERSRCRLTIPWQGESGWRKKRCDEDHSRKEKVMPDTEGER